MSLPVILVVVSAAAVSRGSLYLTRFVLFACRGMAHEVCLQEIDEVEVFLRERLPPLKEPVQAAQTEERAEL